MTLPGPKNERGWNFFERPKGSRNFMLSYRVAPGNWRHHRLPRELVTTRQREAYAAAWVPETLRMLREGVRRPSLASPLDVEPAASGTVRDLADRWMKERRKSKLASNTLRGDVWGMQWIVRELGERQAVEVSSGVLRDFIRSLPTKATKAGTPPSVSSIRNICMTMTTFYEDILADEWVKLPANPMRHPGVVKLIPDSSRVAGDLVIHLTRDVAERLVTCAAVPEWRRVKYLLALTSGARDGELHALTIADADLLAPLPLLRITRQLQPNGKFSPPKRKSVRDVPLDSLAVKELTRWKNMGWARFVGRHPKPSDPLFPNAEGLFIRPKSPKLLRTDLVKAGCSDTFGGFHIDFHATRRSFISWLQAAGVPEIHIKWCVGHKGQGVTQRSYTASDLDAMKRAVETITLNLRVGEVIALPMRAASGAPTPPQTAERDRQLGASDLIAEPPGSQSLDHSNTYGRSKSPPLLVPRHEHNHDRGRQPNRRIDIRLRLPLIVLATRRSALPHFSVRRRSRHPHDLLFDLDGSVME